MADQLDKRAWRPKLSDRVVAELRAAIASGVLKPGAKLPTEQQMTVQQGVSRTVVREAITRLAADGLVTARQGAGVFVNDKLPSFGALLADISGSVAVVLDVLEVRMAVEIEAAALATQRSSSSQKADIEAAFQTLSDLIARGEPTSVADFAFHSAIAVATNNPFYVEILDVLAQRTIPRDLVTAVSQQLSTDRVYQSSMLTEHRQITDAILGGDAERARHAMRLHLFTSQLRYQKLLRKN